MTINKQNNDNDIKKNNNIENLRAANHSQNQCNAKINSKNTIEAIVNGHQLAPIEYLLKNRIIRASIQPPLQRKNHG